MFVWLSQRKAQESNKIVEYDDVIARKCFEYKGKSSFQEKDMLSTNLNLSSVRSMYLLLALKLLLQVCSKLSNTDTSVYSRLQALMLLTP